MNDYRSDFPGYPEQPPYGRPDNRGARPQDPYGNQEPPRDHDHGYRGTLDPGYHLLPVPPNTWGLTTEQQIHALGHKVDELINVFNSYDRKVYGAHEAIVNSALHNDAYYNEITVEDGYIPETGAKYKVVHIPYVDKAGQPIYLELGLPSNSTLNEGLTENCFDASQRTLADKLIPAVNKDTGYTGLALYKHSPIQNVAKPMSLPAGSTGWTLGVTESGYLKIYDTANTTYEQMKWDKIRNAMGVVGLLVNQSEKANNDFMSPDKDQTVARTAIGMNYATRERFIVVVDGDEEHGCLSDQLAEIFLKYHVNVAVETATQGSAVGMDKGEMMFMPPTASIALQADGSPNATHLGAFWYITKRRHYHNDYVKDVAMLMQRLGQNIWMDKIYGHSVDDIEQGLHEVEKQFQDAEEERHATEKDLQSQLDQEKADRYYADHQLKVDLELLEGQLKHEDENLQLGLDEVGGLIGELRDTLRGEMKAGDEADQRKIEERVQDLKKYIQSEDKKLTDLLESQINQLGNYSIERVDTSVEGNKRTYRLIRHDGSDVQVPIEVYDYTSLMNNIGDIVAFEQTFTQFMADYTTWKTDIDNDMRDFSNQVTEFGSRLDADEKLLTQMETTFGQIQERMSALDQTVTSFQSQLVEMELAMENLKQTWAKYYTEWLQTKTEFEQWREQNSKDLQAITEHLEQLDNQIEELKKDQARQDVALNGVIDYFDRRLKTLIEECKTYWQKFDQFEAKVTQDQTNNLKRLKDAEEDRADLWNHMDTAEADVKTLKEQALKDAEHFAELEIARKAQDDHLAALDRKDVELNLEVEKLKEKDTANDGKLESLQTSYEELADRVSTNETHLESVDQHDKEQDTRLDNLEQHDTEGDAQIQSEIEALKEHDTTLDGQIADLQKRDGELTDKDTELEQKHQALEDRVDLLENNAGGDTEKDATQDERLGALETQQSEVSGRVDSLEEELHSINVDAYVQKVGDTMTGVLRVPELELSEAVEFVADGTRAKVRHGDDTDAGNLVVADAAQDDEAVNLGQLNAAKTELEGSIESAKTELQGSIDEALANSDTFVKKTGDTMTGDLMFSQTVGIGSSGHVKVAEVKTNTSTPGRLVITGAVYTNEAVTLLQLNDAKTALEDRIDVLNTTVTGLGDTYVTKEELAGEVAKEQLWTDDGDGGLRPADVTKKVQSPVDPTGDTDAANKKYVDAQLEVAKTYTETAITNLRGQINTLIETYLTKHPIAQYLELSADGTFYKTKDNKPIAVEGE